LGAKPSRPVVVGLSVLALVAQQLRSVCHPDRDVVGLNATRPSRNGTSTIVDRPPLRV
jgi:hypothetical protein